VVDLRRGVAGLALALASACGDDGSSADGGTDTTGVGTSTDGSTSTGAGSSSTTPDPDESTTDATDELPPAPLLVSPLDEALDVGLETELCWMPVEDPDGDEVRYRVFVDDIELTEGRLGDEPGHPGPCLGPLTFATEQTYAWQVQAFEVEDPTRESEKSLTWSFTTENDGFTHTVFEDRFDDDLGWEIEGDATSGAWERGDPVGTFDGGLAAQPNLCGGGASCYFTGQNPDAIVDAADVAGGSTVLLSPAFDLGGAAAATVQLSRFLYKSDGRTGPGLRVELLVPDEDAKTTTAHELELVDAPTADVAANLWTPREYVACGVPMVNGSRLRITAVDEGSGILEAAIDTVSVHAHDFATVCGTGDGGACDPTLGDAACPEDLLCCSQGVVNAGVHRCIEGVAGLDYADPPPDPESPGNGPLGCPGPDLFVDGSAIEPVFTDIMVAADSCLLLEGCVDGTGWRTIMRFDTVTPNIGSDDLALGVPANEPDVFHYSDCHEHYHFDEYAHYELSDGDGLVATGHKQAFCLIDLFPWAWEGEMGTYDCGNQGISRGWSDIYQSDLPCQWIDVTDVAPGDYMLHVELNRARADQALPLLNERDYANNAVDVAVSIP
jgi:hypothetical protein